MNLEANSFCQLLPKQKLIKNIKNLSSFLLPPSRSQSPLSEALELLLSHWGVRLLSLRSCLQQQQQQQRALRLLLRLAISLPPILYQEGL
jgi:hypothetical protein